MSEIHPEQAERDIVAEAIDLVLHEVEAARRDLKMTRFRLQQAEALRRFDRAEVSVAGLLQHCSLTQLRESLYRSRIVNTWGFDMDDAKAVIEQGTDAIGTPPEAPAEAPKPDVKKVRQAAKKVTRKVGPKKKVSKKAKTSAKKSAKKAPKKAKAKKKKAKKQSADVTKT